jgi:hypothetical protein
MKRMVALFSSLLIVSMSYADLMVGGITFDDNAFADAVIDYSSTALFQSYTTDPFNRHNVTAEEALLGSDLRSSTIELQSNEYVSVGFTDNIIYNGSGADLAIFEMFSTPEVGDVMVSVGGMVIAQHAVSLGYMDIGGVSNYVNVAYVDLSDYGFALGQTTDYVRAYGASSEYAAFGAINNRSTAVPEPATISMLLIGFLGLGLSAFRQRKP